MSDDFEQAKSRVRQSEGAYVAMRPLVSSWEQRKLGDLISVYIAHAGPEEDVTVLTSSRDGIQKQEDHFGRLQQHDTSDWNLIPYGYCTYRNRSDDGLFTFNVNKVADRGIVSKFYPVFETSECDADFLVAYLNSSQEIRKKLFVLAVGTSQVVLSYGALKELSLLLPQNREQSAIANVLNHIDNLITLHQRKCQYRGLYGCLSWEQRKLGEIFEEYSEKNRADLPPLTIIQGGGTVYRDESNRNLQFDKNSLSNYKAVNPDDFIVHLRSFEGGLEKATCCGLISPAYHTFHGDGIDSDFYYLYFRSKRFIDTDLKPHVYGIRDGRSIDIDGMKTIPIPWTTVNEQRAIGGFYNSFDSFITLHQ